MRKIVLLILLVTVVLMSACTTKYGRPPTRDGSDTVSVAA